ncbi:MAG TPA: DinB family protein [Chitinophagaceae bacterium]|jgi:uncharacterized damage-inducible protein DinB
MLTESLKPLFNRDLNKLKQEIEAYNNEQRIWATEGGISNSAGNLCLHLVGNLNHFIGKVLGGTDYVRNREAEFSLRNVPRQELVKMIEATVAVVDSSLDKIVPEQLNQEYPIQVFDKKMTVEFFLLHLCTHLSYHLGQVNYHRRLLDK